MISKFVTSELETTKSTVSRLHDEISSSRDSELIKKNELTFKRIAHILHLTRLLQNYALTVGPEVDEGK